MSHLTVNPLDVVGEAGPNQTDVKASSGIQETARAHALEVTHTCPMCKQKMQRMTVGPRSNPIPAWVCVADRICLPLKDGE